MPSATPQLRQGWETTHTAMWVGQLMDTNSQKDIYWDSDQMLNMKTCSHHLPVWVSAVSLYEVG